MTQTAPKPVQLTLEAMLAKFKADRPQLVEPFEKVKPELEAGKGAKALANLLSLEVDMKTEPSFFVYSFVGSAGTFELRTPRPFDPQPQRHNETQQQAQAQEAEASPEVAQEASKPAVTTPELTEATPPAEKPPEAVEEPVPGLFSALSDLLGESTLLMTVAPTGKEGDVPVLTVTVVPQDEKAFEPVCLEGTVNELDTQFISALTARAVSKKSLAEQIEALKAADKALEEAKKQEVAAKNKQVDTKKKAADKKEQEAKAEEAKAKDAKVEEAKVEEQAETEKQQEALF